ncbi:MAG: class I SAM-dependent methyltransferase [Sulfurovum sp.]|nr:class I SAM-dependent methyltransferase [Sulfurovum sp.]
MANTIDSLDLYAKVEDLLENSEAIEKLYGYYYDILSQLSFSSLLDIGCGSGTYLTKLQKKFPHIKAKGIDLSPVMVERAKAKGVDAEATDLCMVEGKYDVITAVFDMINYLPAKALESFFFYVGEHLNKGGFFIFDINTLYGFENVAVGALITEDKERFLAIDSNFEAGEYRADFTLFEQKGNCFVKEKNQIKQYFHSKDSLGAYSNMKLISVHQITLYIDEPDKLLLVFQKV